MLVQTRYSALSRGTESLIFQGAVPETEHRRMRAPFQAGVFPFPVKYGYVVVGTVTVGPRDRSAARSSHCIRIRPPLSCLLRP